jgi:hypothetical protein
MVYTHTFTRKERDAIEEKIPGSKAWAKMKSQETGIYRVPITRNSIYKNKKTKTTYQVSRFDEAVDNGWVLHDGNTWTHPQYRDQRFSSIFQQTVNGLSPLPYGGNDDEKGLAYVFDNITCGGQYKRVKPNRWLSEEFDTRRGKRRNKFIQKKEAKKKFLESYYKETMGNEKV